MSGVALKLGMLKPLLPQRCLMGLLVAYTSFLVLQSRRESATAKAQTAEVDEFETELQAALPGAWDTKLPAQLALMAAGLVLLVLGSDWLFSAAAVIALTVVAGGARLVMRFLLGFPCSSKGAKLPA